MIWVPIVLGLFKIGVLGAAMFFAIKSHYDGEKQQEREREAGGQIAGAENVAVTSKLD
ncbi:hypothetical protein [Martelella radicis]|uniref:Uncharacterized protein n=1 Tax=Martelella radicis TaxID=1397476 RepID=A0A7W6KMY7_9HYPH|nr:hypothetical protein [Martelella radicis]MBB4124173.1 hypothetical protein [Martelella radicis]